MSTADSIDRIVAASNLLIEAGERFGADTPKGFATFSRVVDAVLRRFQNQLPPPEPVAHSRPWHPCPADFQHEIPIGELCGTEVHGLMLWREETGTAEPYGVKAELNGLQICAYPPTDGDPNEFLNIDAGQGLGAVGDIFWHEARRLIELAQIPGDPLGQLMAMAREFCAAEAPAADRRAA